ncbi:MAG: DUF4251 domain-containing protein [Bacteroidales bacterium]|nr:DUF4251 domain-containing protein [Bacteroidales bacterium]MBN2820798.1 DUF4251 domain-containing protein [Bacteroidales bacterium]
MRYLFSSLVFVIFWQISYSQEDDMMSKKEIRMLEREQKIAQQEVLKEKQNNLTWKMLNDRKFVLEADFLSDGYGNRISVSPTLNFITIDSTRGVIQIGTLTGMGYNGLGGVTTEGKISSYEIKVAERKHSTSYMLSTIILTPLGIFDINFTVSESGYATATIKSSVRGQLTYSGSVIEPAKSRVFKGSQSY